MKKLAFLILPFLLLPSYSLAKSFGDYEGAIYVRNYDGDTITFGEMDQDKKHQISHRADAFRKLVDACFRN